MNRIISLALPFLTVILLYFYFFPNRNEDSYSSAIFIFCFIISTVIFFLGFKIKEDKFHKRCTNISIVYFFLLGYVIVGFQKYFDLFFGYVDASDRFYFIKENLINKGIILSTIGLIGLHLGYSIKTKSFEAKSFSILEATRCFSIFKNLYVFSFIIFLYYNASLFLSGAYSQAYIEARFGTMGMYSEILLRSTFCCSCIFKILSNRGAKETLFHFIKSFGFFFNICFFTYMLLVLISGDRGPLISILLILFFTFYISQYKKKIKFCFLLVLIFVAANIFSFLGDFRSNKSENVSYSSIVDRTLEEMKTSENSSLISPTNELATSVRCLHYAMDYVPQYHSFLYGSFQFRDICYAVPFSSSITKHFLNQDSRYVSSEMFITYIEQGPFYTSGVGTSILADLYLSFGIFGVFGGLFVLGFFLKRIDTTLAFTHPKNYSLFFLVILLPFIGNIIYMSRSSLLGPLKLISFTFLLIFFVRLILNYRRHV